MTSEKPTLSTQTQTEEASKVVLKPKAQNQSLLKEKYESFWLFPESHPWRLAEHITLRGMFLGAEFGLLGGTIYAIRKRKTLAKGQFLPTIGRIAFRGSLVGGALMALTAARFHYTLEEVGITDRSYRIAYNWGQTKWDMFGVGGAAVGAALLRRPFGGVLPGLGVGIALGSFLWIGTTIAEKVSA